MTPRMLRSAIARGEMTAVDPKIYRGKAPAPPPEWPTWRQDRLKVAIRAALLFLQGKPWQEISRSLEQDGMLEKDRVERGGPLISKARVNQYVDVGIKFLVDRACFRTINGKDIR